MAQRPPGWLVWLSQMIMDELWNGPGWATQVSQEDFRTCWPSLSYPSDICGILANLCGSTMHRCCIDERMWATHKLARRTLGHAGQVSVIQVTFVARQLSWDCGITRPSRRFGLTCTRDTVRNCKLQCKFGEISNASKIASGSQGGLQFVEAIVSSRNIDTFPLTLLISEKRERGRMISTSLQWWECKSNTSNVELLDGSASKEARIDNGCPRFLESLCEEGLSWWTPNIIYNLGPKPGRVKCDALQDGVRLE